jgi:hypothetical protein
MNDAHVPQSLFVVGKILKLPQVVDSPLIQKLLAELIVGDDRGLHIPSERCVHGPQPSLCFKRVIKPWGTNS